MKNQRLGVASSSLVSLCGLAALATAAGCGSSPPGGSSTGIGGDGGPGRGGSNGGPLCSSDVKMTGAGGSAGFGFNNGGLAPQLGATITQAEPPPAISGGTLRVLRDGVTAVAADPDRDRVYVVDLPTRAVRATVDLQKGDEPGRIAEDGAGRVHVALRRGGALVTIAPATGQIVERRDACAAPRGVAYQAATDSLHVACAGGELVTFPAAGGAATRNVKLEGDLRDVIVEGDRLLVTRFRSAQLITVEANGTSPYKRSLPIFRSQITRGGQAFSAAVAWKATEAPVEMGGGAVILHQRGVDDPIQPAMGGYGGVDPCNAIVQTAVTTVSPDGQMKAGPAMAGMVVAVDMALSPDGSRIAIVAAGNAHNAPSSDSAPVMPRVFVTDMASATDQVIGCRPDGMHGPCLPPMGGGPPIPAPEGLGEGDEIDPPTAQSSGGAPGIGTTGAGGVGSGDTGVGGIGGGAGGAGGSTEPPACFVDGTPVAPDPSVPNVVGEPIAIAWADGVSGFVVQSREPALLQLPGGARIALASDTRLDTGHSLFHANAGAGVACASCHPEGNEDSRVWKFACEGSRRTQSLQTGLRGTEPFHWSGEERDFSALVRDVFMGRMSGPALADDQMDATLRWIDAQPRPALSRATDAATLSAVERGRALFNDGARGACATCHTGARFTNSATVDVGTGGVFQVPSLIGIGSRGPFMHDGCAQTLRGRFDAACGGGNKHGVTSGMSEAELSDLVAYLNTL